MAQYAIDVAQENGP